MPLYSGLSATTDSIVVVIDIGAAYTKFGFSGDHSPRCIIPSEVKCRNTDKTRKIFDFRNEQDLYDLLVDFMHVLCFKYALICPKDKSVVIIESLLCPTLFRETLAKVLFCYYEVASVLILPSHLVALSTLNVETALVLDMGYTEATAVPVCHGVPVLSEWQSLPVSSAAVHSNLKQMIQSENIDLDLDEEIVEDIKVRCCFVTTSKRAVQFVSGDKSLAVCPSVEYPIKGIRTITISGKVRETAFEPLFALDNDMQSVPTMILDAIMKSPLDMRKPLAENIIIMGGGAMVPGFKARIKEELYNLLKFDRYKNSLYVKKFKFHTCPCKDNYTAWLGGSIYGCTEIVSLNSLKKEAYLTDFRIPEWCILQENDGTKKL